MTAKELNHIFLLSMLSRAGCCLETISTKGVVQAVAVTQDRKIGAMFES